jgi:hypothetical protein
MTETQNAETYPTQIVIFCDDCGVEHVADYLVSEDDDQETRFGYARAQAAKDGWLIMPGHLDMCPACSFC